LQSWQCGFPRQYETQKDMIESSPGSDLVGADSITNQLRINCDAVEKRHLKKDSNCDVQQNSLSIDVSDLTAAFNWFSRCFM